jgi:pimeloyl-ACP methyl ester carboxylesterase
LKQIQFKNTSISYSDTGKGTAIVLLHGFLENQSMWDIHTFFLKKNRVITIDLLGHGETECLGYVHTMEDNADAVHSVLLELGIRKSILVAILWVVMYLAFAELS